MTAVVAPPTWNTVADAAFGLAPLLDSAGGVSNVLVKLDTTNEAQRDNAPAYRLADGAIALRPTSRQVNVAPKGVANHV